MSSHATSQAIVRPLLVGQVGFVAGLTICFALKPQFLRSEGGFSNYGVTALTTPFFTLAFVFAAVGTWLAARRMTASRPRFALALRVLAALFLLVLLSTYPYKLNNFYDVLHQDVSIALSVLGLALGGWLTFKRHGVANVLLFACQLAATGAAIITILGWVHVLFVSQLTAGFAFSVLLVRATSQIVGASK